MEINVVYCLFVVDFIHLASRRKIIKHRVVGGTSHLRVSKIWTRQASSWIALRH